MGYKLLKPIEGMEEIAEIILHHHERCDGKGYPSGLTCDEIPMLSKIIAVVDAFDAMVNRRVYRKALSLEEAKEEIKRNLGTQFDKYIGSMFLEIADEVYKVITEEQEESDH
jgi:HD-GYP domain-containing protein (c-di-GMP phosphodiesterase class II)